MHCLLSRCAVAAGVGTPLRCDAPCAAAGTAAAMQATNWLLGKKPTSPSAASAAAVSSSVKEAASPPDGQEASSDGASEAREPSAPAKRPQQSNAMQCLLVYLGALVRAAVGTCRDRRNTSLRLAALPTRRSCGGRHGAPNCNANPSRTVQRRLCRRPISTAWCGRRERRPSSGSASARIRRAGGRNQRQRDGTATSGGDDRRARARAAHSGPNGTCADRGARERPVWIRTGTGIPFRTVGMASHLAWYHTVSHLAWCPT